MCYFSLGLFAALIVNPLGKKVAGWLSLHSLTTPWCSRGPSWVLGKERGNCARGVSTGFDPEHQLFCILDDIIIWLCESYPLCPPCPIFHLLCPPLLLPLHCNLSPARNLPSSLRKESVTLISSLKIFPGLGGGYKTWCSLLEGNDLGMFFNSYNLGVF